MIHRCTIPVFYLFLVLYLFPGAGYAGERSDSTYTGTRGQDSAQSNAIRELDKIVVTATRTKRRIAETPASVTTLSRATIDIMPALGVSDLMQHELGVQMKRYAGVGEGMPNDIIMRAIPGGFASTRVMVLVDGLPTNVSGTPFLIINEVPLGAIKSVEIVRGPYSSLYGANAFSGAVNILTHDGDGRPNAKAFFHTSVPFTMIHEAAKKDGYRGAGLVEKSVGEAYYNAEIQSSGGNERYTYFVTAGALSVGNYLASDSAFVSGANIDYFVPAENRDYRDYRIFGKFGIQITPHADFELHTRYFNSDLGGGKTKKVYPDSFDIDIQGEKLLLGPFVHFHPFGNLDVRVGGFYRRVNGDFYNEWPRPTPDTTDPSYWGSSTNDWQVEIRSVTRLGKYNILVAGMENLWNTVNFGAARHRTEDSLLYNAFSVDTGIINFGAYIQDEISIGQNVLIVPGVRADYHSDFGLALSPKLGANFSLFEGVRLRLSGGRAFRA
ncbi:MAG: TonB-dependent receptor plug domain-containing protein, partial [Chitinivibrionales bacterium]|nr:TonB-dependent receptor plug domain-containing protein [Chitinivibrionales bacterium]